MSQPSTNSLTQILGIYQYVFRYCYQDKNKINEFGSLVNADCEGLSMIWVSGQV